MHDIQYNRFSSQLKCTMFENSVNCVTGQTAPFFHKPCISILVAVQNSKMGPVPNPVTIFTMFILANVCYGNYIYLLISCITFKNMMQFCSFGRYHNWLHNKSCQINQELDNIYKLTFKTKRYLHFKKKIENCAWKHFWYVNCVTKYQLCYKMSTVLQTAVSSFLNP